MIIPYFTNKFHILSLVVFELPFLDIDHRSVLYWVTRRDIIFMIMICSKFKFKCFINIFKFNYDKFYFKNSINYLIIFTKIKITLF